MDPKLRSMINVASVIIYAAAVFAFYDYVIVRLVGIIVVAAIQMALSVVIIAVFKGDRHARRMEFSMICICLAVTFYVIFVIVNMEPV